MSRYSTGIEIKAVDKFSKVLDKFSYRISRVSKVTATAQSRLNNFRNATEGVTTALKRMALVGGVALGGLGVMITKVGMEYEDAMARFKALTNASSEGLETASEASLASSKKYGVAVSEIIDARTKFASSMSQYMEVGQEDNLSKVVDSFTKLGTIAKVSSDIAQKTMSTILGSYKNLTADDADTVVDKLAQSATDGKFAIDKLTQALPKNIGILSQSGIGFEDALSFNQILAKTELEPSTVGRMGKNIMLKLKAAIPKIGNGIGLWEALEKVNAKDLDIDVLGKEFGSENVIGAVKLLKEYALGAKYSNKVLNDSAGRSDRMLGDVMKTLSKQFGVLKAEVSALAIGIYTKFLGPALIYVVKRLKEFVQWLGSGGDGAKELITTMATFGAVLVGVGATMGVVFGLGAIAMWAKASIAAIMSVGTVLNVMFGGLPLIIGGIITLIGALIPAAALLQGEQGGKSFWATLLDDLKEYWAAFSAPIKNAFEMVKSMLSGVFGEFEGNSLLLKFVLKELIGFIGFLIAGVALVIGALVVAIAWIGTLFASFFTYFEESLSWFKGEGIKGVLKLLAVWFLDAMTWPMMFVADLALSLIKKLPIIGEKFKDFTIRGEYESLRNQAFGIEDNRNNDIATGQAKQPTIVHNSVVVDSVGGVTQEIKVDGRKEKAYNTGAGNMSFI